MKYGLEGIFEDESVLRIRKLAQQTIREQPRSKHATIELTK